MNKLIERLLDTGRLSPVQMQELFDDIEEALEAADHVIDMWDTGTSREIIDAAEAYRNLTQETPDA